MSSSLIDISLPNIESGGLGHADVVAQALRHLLHAVQALEQRRRHHDLRLEPVGRHDVAADVEVEELIGAAELDVRFERHRVVRLRERIQELVHGDRLARLEALPELTPLEHLRDVVPGCELESRPSLPSGLEPAAVELDDGPVADRAS